MSLKSSNWAVLGIFDYIHYSRLSSLSGRQNLQWFELHNWNILKTEAGYLSWKESNNGICHATPKTTESTFTIESMIRGNVVAAHSI
jgi:hypothetical protein